MSQARAGLAQTKQSVNVSEQALQAAIDQAKQNAATNEKSLQGQVNQAKIALDFARANSGGSATSAQQSLDQANAQLQADQTKYNLDTGNLNGVVGATDGAKDSLQAAQAAVTNDNLQIQKIKEYQITYSCTTTCQFPWDPLTLSQLQYRLTADQQVVSYWNSIVSDQAAVTKDGQSVASAQHSLGSNAVSNQQSITNAGSAYTNAVRNLEKAKIRVGQPATIQVAALPNVELAAHVIGIDTDSTIVSNVVTYYATIQLDNNEPGLKPGMTVTASIIVGKADNVLNVPNAAVRGSGANASVTTVDSKGAE